MKRFVFSIIFTLLFYTVSGAAILVQSPNGSMVVKADLATASTSADSLGKKIVVTSPVVLTTAVTITGRQIDVTGQGKITYSGSGSLKIAPGCGIPTPFWFGADATGATDSTAAIQAAIDAIAPALPGNSWDLNGNAGGTVQIPAGKYSVSSIFIPSWVNVIGAGRPSTMLSANSSSVDSVISMGAAFTGSMSGTTLTVSAMTSGRITVGEWVKWPTNGAGVQITGFLSGTNGGVGTYSIASAQTVTSVKMWTPSYYVSLSGLTVNGNSRNINGISNYSSFWTLNQIDIMNCNYNGLYLFFSFTGKAYDTYINGCSTSAGYAGIYFDGIGSGTGVNDVSFFGGAIGASFACYDSVRFKHAIGVTFNGMSFQSSKRNVFNFDGSGTTTNVTVRDCYFETNVTTDAGAAFYGTLSYVTVDNNVFGGGAGQATKFFAVDALNGCKITNNFFGGSGYTALIGMTNEAGTATFTRNTISGNTADDDATPLFTTALKAIVDPILNVSGSVTSSRVDHLTQYQLQVATLSSYEATMTPTTSGTITLDAANNHLSYTKIGRLVHVQGQLQVASVSSPVGTSVRVSLPYVITSGDLPATSERIGGVSITATPTVVPFSGDGGNLFINLLLDAATIAGGQFYRFSFSYVTD